MYIYIYIYTRLYALISLSLVLSTRLTGDRARTEPPARVFSEVNVEPYLYMFYY